MKKIILSLTMASAIISCNSSKTVDDPLAESGRTQRTENLLANLKNISENGYPAGHQDATVYGVGWVGDNGIVQAVVLLQCCIANGDAVREVCGFNVFGSL